LVPSEAALLLGQQASPARMSGAFAARGGTASALQLTI
jgi:hypothetical protein